MGEALGASLPGGFPPRQSGRGQLDLSHSWGGAGACERGHGCVGEGSAQKLESLVREVEEEAENADLKLSIRTKITASGPVISWQTDGETVETVAKFIFLGSKVTADGDCSHEIKTCFLLGRKALTNLDSILRSRDITLLTKVCLVKAVVFPVVMYGCESWTIKKAER